MKTKRSQMEMLGLSIIVLLLILIMVFVVRYIVLKEPEDYREEYLKTQLASNVVNTFLHTTTPCHDLTITELVQDCAESYPGKGNIDCGTHYSCQYVKNTTATILRETLDRWKMEYYLQVYQQENNPIISLGQEWDGEKESEMFTIPTKVAPVFVQIDIH